MLLFYKRTVWIVKSSIATLPAWTWFEFRGYLRVWLDAIKALHYYISFTVCKVYENVDFFAHPKQIVAVCWYMRIDNREVEQSM